MDAFAAESGMHLKCLESPDKGKADMTKVDAQLPRAVCESSRGCGGVGVKCNAGRQAREYHEIVSGRLEAEVPDRPSLPETGGGQLDNRYASP